MEQITNCIQIRAEKEMSMNKGENCDLEKQEPKTVKTDPSYKDSVNSKLKVDNELLEIEILNLQNSVDLLKANYQTVSDTNQLLNDQIKRLQNAPDSDLRSKNAKLLCENTKLKIQVADLQKTLGATGGSNAASPVVVPAPEVVNKEPRKASATQQKDVKLQKKAETKTKVGNTGLEEKVKSLQTALNEQKAKSTSVNAEKRALEEKVSGHEKEIARLKGNSTKFTSEKKTLDQKMQRLQSKVNDLEANNKKMVENTKSLQKEIAELKTTNSGLMADYNTSEQKIRKLEKEVDEWKEKNTRQTEKITSLEETIRKLQQDVPPPRPSKGAARTVKSPTSKVAAIPGKTEKTLFYVINCCQDYKNGENFEVELLLSTAPTNGEVRSAIARVMSRKPDETQLERDIARWRGKAVFSVGASEYADKSGTIHDFYAVEDEGLKLLFNDDEAFTIVKNRKNRIQVSAGTPFYFVNYCEDFNDKESFHADLMVSRTPTVGEVRKAVALFMNRAPEETKLERLCGSTNGKIYYPVMDEDTDLSFADVNGVCHSVDKLTKEVLINDEDRLPIVSGLVNRLYVSPR